MWISSRGNNMENRSTHNLANPDVWIRLVYMIVFWLLLVVARFAIGLLGLLQFLLVLLTGSDNDGLRRMGASVSQWTLQTMRFLTFNTEDKPFPFQEWPGTEENPTDAAASAQPEAERLDIPTSAANHGGDDANRA